ncbi:hypothetical protein BpHYR1_022724 [Brachionus plicatilis]|uniref:Uncharacterized protein n=1 Tax=Brachionus plicatilis TaxID=10195 RepID=A0A3M7Q1H8_BRAPC|nr:hypothetical protein BpHYR1_022724 [Brachionus plicatilis]
MDQMLKSHRCFHLNKEGFVLLNHSIAFQGNKPRQHLNDMSKNLNCKIKCLEKFETYKYLEKFLQRRSIEIKYSVSKKDYLVLATSQNWFDLNNFIYKKFNCVLVSHLLPVFKRLQLQSIKGEKEKITIETFSYQPEILNFGIIFGQFSIKVATLVAK